MPENENENEVLETNYEMHNWQHDEVIQVSKMMNIENGIKNLNDILGSLQIMPMSGATEDVDGVAGYVPQPLKATHDYNKFLRGDATWTNDGSALTNLNASAVTSGSLSPDYLGNDIPGTKIKTGTITVDQLSPNGVLGSIKEGTISAEYIGDIPAQKIVVESGSTIDTDALPVFGLNTSGIVAAPASVTGGFLKDNATWAVPFTTQTVTLTTFVNNVCTVEVNGITVDSTIIVSPAPASLQDYNSYGIYCSAQNNGSLEFTAKIVPEYYTPFTVNIIIM